MAILKIARMGDEVPVANSYSRGDREFEKATAMLFPSKVAAQRSGREFRRQRLPGKETEKLPPPPSLHSHYPPQTAETRRKPAGSFARGIGHLRCGGWVGERKGLELSTILLQPR